jgi:GNAT superfamily N-acetyltransferase
MTTNSISDRKMAIRTMTRAELDTVVGWAGSEGWNPGKYDAPSNHAADPDGYIAAVMGGELVGSISAVRYESHYGFMGFFIVKPDVRAQGIGRLLWSEALRRLEGRVVGLDGVMAMIGTYARSGFVSHHSNVRHRIKAAPATMAPTIRRISSLPLAKLLEFDRAFHPAARAAYLDSWVRIPGSHGFASVTDGQLEGYGIIRPSRSGWRIGPLFANNPLVAANLLDALLASVPAGEEVFMDVPACNREAVKLATSRAEEQLFETSRMYKGPAPAVNWAGVFGVTSLELG